MVVWLLGVALYLTIAGLPPLGLPGLAPWLGATLPTYLFGLIAYGIVGGWAPRPKAGVVPCPE